MRRIALLAMANEEHNFKRAQELLGFRIISSKKKFVDNHGFDQPEGFGQAITSYEVGISDFQYTVFHETARRMKKDLDLTRKQFDDAFKQYREGSFTESDSAISDKCFKETGLAGWLLNHLIFAMRNENDIIERFAALKLCEQKGTDPMQIVKSRVFHIQFV